MSNTQAKEYELYFEVEGKGYPLVLMPGFATGSWIWYKQLPELSRYYQTIVFDNRGVGRSERLIFPYNMQSMVNDVLQLLNFLGIEKAHILGASMGGFIAQELALQHSERVASLILCCTSFGGKNHVSPSAETLLALASLQDPNSEPKIRKSLNFAFAPEFQRLNPQEIEKVVEKRLANPILGAAYVSQLQAAMAFDTEDRLATLQIPTLVVTGDQDLMVPAENSHNLVNRIKGAKLVVINGAGHSVFIESAQTFNQLVIDFLHSIPVEKK